MNSRQHRKLSSIVMCMLLSFGLVGLLLPGAPAVAAEKPGAGAGDVSEAFGTFTEDLDIEVPDFHGMEPDLGFSYNSSVGNTYLGVGWTLTGDSFVERVSPGGGSPRYDSSDVYLLDGQALVGNCTTFGGTHCPKYQTYQRISFDTASNTWNVWDKDGTRSTYTSTVTPHFRWNLASRTDTNGNTVTYSHVCPTSLTCYLDRITYPSAGIYFYSETRPDPVSFATGTALRTTSTRLKSVLVTSGGSNLRAYKLTYEQSATSGRSLLKSVQEFGRDVVMDASGTISTGTSMPAITFTWQPSDLTFNYPPLDTNGNTVGLDWFWTGEIANPLTGDFNGDGRADLLRQEKGSWGQGTNSTIRVYLAKADGTFQLGPVDVNGNATGLGGDWTGDLVNAIPADFNADGKTDLLYQQKGSWGQDIYTNVLIFLSNGDGTFRYGPYDANGNANGLDHQWNGDLVNVYPSDFNGDGIIDLLYQHKNIWGYDQILNILVFLGNGDGTFRKGPYDANGNASGLGPDWNGDLVNIYPADFNGDGKTDLFYQQKGSWGNDKVLNALVYFSNGDGSFRAGPYDGTYNATGLGGDWSGDLANVYPADYNVDGKTDLLYQQKGSWGNDSILNILVFMSNGDGSFQYGPYDANYNAIGLGADWNGDFVNVVVGDFNSDGRTDLIRQEKGAWASADNIRTVEMYTAFGNSFRKTPVDTNGNALGLDWPWNGDHTNIVTDDFNGDGKTDLLRQEKAAWGGDAANNIQVRTQPAGFADLLIKIGNGMGGSVAVSYVPSSTWNSINMPVGPIFHTVSRVEVDDGRGVKGSTSYTYSNARWSAALRQPLGYEVNRAVEGDGSIVDTHNRQTDASPGVVEHVISRDSAGNIYSWNQKTFLETGAPIYNSLVSGDYNYAYNLTTTPRTTKTTFDYDGYGNVYQTIDYGDTALTSDDQTVYNGFYPNTSAYIVGDEAYENVFAGIGTGGALISQSLNAYDGAASYTTPPTKGNLTKLSVWNSKTGGYSETSYTYNTNGTPATITNPLGRVSRLNYDPSGRFANQTCNAFNQCASQVIDPTLNVATSATDENGTVTTMTYDAFGRVKTKTDPAGNQTRWDYNNMGDANTQHIQMTYPNGLVVQSFQDGLGREYQTVKRGTNGVVIATQLTVYRDASEEVWKQSLWYGPSETVRYLVSEYDGLGRVTKVTNPDGSFERTIYTNDGAGKPYVATYDELNHEEVRWSDSDGRVTQIREKNGTSYATTTFQYDLLGNKVRTVDALNNVTSVAYNSLGQRLSTTDVDMGTWNYSYDNGSQLITETDARGQATTFTYDIIGRMKTKTVGSPEVAHFSDAFASQNTTNWTLSSHNTVPFADTSGSVVKSTGTGTTWDANLFRNAYTLSNGKAMELRFKVDSATAYSRFSIEANDPVARRFGVFVKDGKVSVQYMADGTTFVYPGDLLPSVQLNSWYKVQLTVNDNDGMKAEVWLESDPTVRGTYQTRAMPAGKTWRFHHWNYRSNAFMDDYKEITPGTLKRTEWFYDEAGYGASIGNMTRVVFPGGEKRQTWNNLGLPAATTTCIETICKTMQTSYDSMQRLGTLTYPDNEAVTYTYDSAGNLASVSGYVNTMLWSAGGQLKSMTYANGTTTTFTYDPSREWLKTANVAKDATQLYAASYGYDLVGNVSTMSQGTATTTSTTYGYDDLNRLTGVSGAQAQTFGYDAVGNLTSSSVLGTYTSDAAHKHATATAGGNTYTYDANGNMRTGAGRTLTWDANNQLTTVTKGNITTSFAYDENEQRLTKTTNGVTTKYFNPMLEQVNGAMVQYYYAGPMLVAKKDGATKTWYHADRLGSMRLMTDASGVSVRSYDYLPYGALSASTGTATNERGYTGHITDGETGLVYMGARYYDPVLGRFISPDTIIPESDSPQALNRYTYVYNNPVNNTDPSGHRPWRARAVSRLHSLTRSYRAERDAYRRAVKRGDSVGIRVHGRKARAITAERGNLHDRIKRSDVQRAEKREQAAERKRNRVDASVSGKATHERGGKRNIHGGKDKSKSAGGLAVGATKRLGKIKIGPLSVEIKLVGSANGGSNKRIAAGAALQFKACLPIVGCKKFTGPSFSFSAGKGGFGFDASLASIDSPPIKIPLPGPIHIELTVTGKIGVSFGFRDGKLSLPGVEFKVAVKKDKD